MLIAGSTVLATSRNGVDREREGIEKRQNDSTSSSELGRHSKTTLIEKGTYNFTQ